jgi:hypothetical protein
MGQLGFAPAGPNPGQQPLVKPYPPTRVQQRPDVYVEQSDPLPDSDAYADRYRDPDPYPARGREPDGHRDDPYDDRYRDRERDRDRDRDRDRGHDERRYADRDRDRGDRFRGPSADAIGRTIQVLTALVALVFVLHVVFVIARANQSNGFVAFTYGTAKFFVLGLGDVFTPNDAAIGVILNYGLAAVIYLVAGRIIARALKR